MSGGGPLSYAWTQIGGPVSVYLSPIVNPSFSAPANYINPAEYTFQVVVTDDSTGRVASDTVTVEVAQAFQATNYSMHKFVQPFQFGNHIGNGNKIELNANNTGVYSDLNDSTSFTWFESDGKLILDLSEGGPHTLHTSTFIEGSVEVEETTFLDSLEIHLILNTPGIDQALFKRFTTIVRTENGTRIAPDRTSDATFAQVVYAAESAIPFTGLAGTSRTLLAELGTVVSTLDDPAGFALDEFSFDADGINGTTRYKMAGFQWAVSSAGYLQVIYPPINSNPNEFVHYYHFETQASGDIVFADYTLPNGDNRVGVNLSFSRNDGPPPPTWDEPAVPGIYITRGSMTLENGEDRLHAGEDRLHAGEDPLHAGEYRLHAGGVGVLEFFPPDFTTGIPQATRSSFALCWEVDGGDLIVNRISTSGQGFVANVPDVSFCSMNIASESSVNFRRTNALFTTESPNIFKTLVLTEVNNGLDFPIPNGILEIKSTFSRILEHAPFSGSGIPPVITDSYITVPTPSSATAVSMQVDAFAGLDTNVLDDGELDFGSVEILVDPLFGSVNVLTSPMANEGDIVYTSSIGIATLDIAILDSLDDPVLDVNNAGSYRATATVLDASGNPLPGVDVTFSTTTGFLSPTIARTDENGFAFVVIFPSGTGPEVGFLDANASFVPDSIVYRISDEDGNPSTFGTIHPHVFFSPSIDTAGVANKTLTFNDAGDSP
jgi:hypothetical protein